MSAWSRIKKCWTVIDKVLPAVPIVLLVLGVTRYLWCRASESPITSLTDALERRLGEADSMTVPLHEAFPGDWDQCCVLGPYSSPALSARKMGVSGWWILPLVMEVHDGIETIAFVRDGWVREWVQGAGASPSMMGIENNVSPYPREALVVIRRSKSPFSEKPSITMYRPGHEVYESLFKDEGR